jgi:hypothetical protein
MMKNKQSGGLLLPYKNTEESEEIFRNFINNSNIKILTSGTNGIILTADLKNDISKNYSTISPDENFGKPVKNIIIKLCLINENSKEIKLSNKLSVHSVTEEEFQDEINIQTDIYLKTIQYLQPLCPGIVYANITNNNELINILISRINDSDNLSKLKSTAFTTAGFKLGIIGMEMLSNSEILNNIKTQNTLAMGKYILLKLALETGYNHNDFHCGNILIEKCENYFNNIKNRPIVIDFGRTTKINPDIMSKIKNEVNNKNYIKALKYLCHFKTGNEYTQDPEYESFYGWICKNYNLDDPNYFKELAQNLVNIDSDYNLDDINIKLTNNKNNFKKYDEENENNLLDALFRWREQAIDNNILLMDKLHKISPQKYPLLPISTTIKNNLFSGIIGGKKRRYSKKNSRTKKNRNKNSRTKKRRF